ncbi:MAG: hypothetical protein MZU97_00585 [Bacillus subtilis]|nr:hypothetical protein [Bacillus subtilis]
MQAEEVCHGIQQSFRWWKNAVVYQIYPLSFARIPINDGIGDLNGITRYASTT